MRTRVLTLALCLALVTATALPAAASSRSKDGGAAAADDLVTLMSSKKDLRFGRATQLSGTIDPATPDQTVAILDSKGTVVADDLTNAEGVFKLWYKPRANVSLTAQWLEASSAPVTVKVRPIVEVKLGDVKPFSKATIRGNVRPAMPGRRVIVVLNRFGKPVGRKKVALKNGRWFRTKVYVPRTGTYRARAIVESPSHLKEAARTGTRRASMPRLDLGDRNQYVKLLEKRLRALGYYLPRADEFFDFRTRDALIAFNKVQRRARVGTYVDAATWAKLQEPVKPRPRHKKPGGHIEIDQTRQVLFVVRKGKVKWILHTSTGAGGATRDGSFRVTRRLAGYSPNRLYYPSYFDGLRAIHGWPEVPTYPASHGCSRVPMWSATWIYGHADVGTRIYVYH